MAIWKNAKKSKSRQKKREIANYGNENAKQKDTRKRHLNQKAEKHENKQDRKTGKY